MTYHLLREFADSWGLLMMVALFLGVVVFTFRPGSKAIHDDSAALPLRNEKAPRARRDGKGGRP
jgi:cytochrome c oxidase cbb3-type subunit 4